MTTFRAVLPRALGASALGIAASILTMSLGMHVANAVTAPSMREALTRLGDVTIVLVLWVATLLGMVPAMLVCAPIFAYAAAHGRASLRFSLALGAAPGLVMLVVGAEAGVTFLVYGVPAAAFTHMFFRSSSLWTRADDPA